MSYDTTYRLIYCSAGLKLVPSFTIEFQIRLLSYF
jgi:hypothetical protein